MFPTPTLPAKTINELLKHWASTPNGNLPAFVSFSADGTKRCLSRREVYQLSAAFAHKLHSHGVRKGDIISVSLPNCLERIICDMGVLLAGATSMNGQICRADGEDFIQSLKVARAKFVITDPSLHNGAWQFLRHKIERSSEGFIQHESLPDLHRVLICERSEQNLNEDFISQLRSSKAQLCLDVSPTDLATIMTTSGSTGYSKLVPLTHSNLHHFCLQVKEIEPLKEGDRFINCAPLGWAGGYPQWYLGCGVTRYFIDMHNGPPTDMPKFLWNIITTEKIFYGFLSPIYTSTILQNSSLWENSDWKPRILCLAGQPVNQGHLEIIGKLCQAVDVNYGMTECNLVSTHRIQDPSSFKSGCAGFPGYGVKIKIVDRNKQEVSKGTTGEILLQSPSLTSGYLNNEAAVKAAFTSDGWFCTDDAGYIDPKTGKIHVEGRQSDSIMRGSYIFYPNWLEQMIRKMEKVKDVVIVPVPDKVLHNEICACILTDIPFNGVKAGSLSFEGKDNSTYSVEDGPESSLTSSRSGPELCKENGVDETDHLTVIDSYDLKMTLLNGLCKSRSNDLEDINKIGMKKQLSMPCSWSLDLIKTQDQSTSVDEVKQAGADSVFMNENNTASSIHCIPSLLMLEQEIRQYCQNSQLLHPSDAMRMVPKYYVFFNRFSMTDTGKINREEITKHAISALTKE